MARQDFELLVLDKIFAWWLEEAALIPGVLPDDMGPFVAMSHSWRWPRFRHIDPLKQAQADIALWNAGLLSDEQYCHENDRDPEEHYASLGRQYANRRRIFLPLPGENPLQPITTRSDETTTDQEEPADAE